MGAPSFAAVATDALLVSLADPHLLVLGVLVGAWVVDKLLAAVAHLEGAGPGNAPERTARRGEPDAVGDDGRRPSGAE
ncbi:hypothetical protein HWV07_10350 [Natronomonas salina]|uniref:hypothetical protein n=1 Tax=Natronomonas salina TaxID=1710540 RepID=UPI0015B3E19C|nr:hypothetical protein [Natronomonas salina]QLD89407.1 hypothetical protein HWV07_10350 [Natronomonas salina]